MTTTQLLKTSTINLHEIAVITGLDRRQIPMDIIPIFLSYLGDPKVQEQEMEKQYRTIYRLRIVGPTCIGVDVNTGDRLYNTDQMVYKMTSRWCKCCDQHFSSDSSKVMWNHMKSDHHLRKVKKFHSWKMPSSIKKKYMCRRACSKNRLRWSEYHKIDTITPMEWREC